MMFYENMWSLVGAILLTTSGHLLNDASATDVSLSLLVKHPPLTVATEVASPDSQSAWVAEQAVQNMILTMRKSGYADTAQGVWIQSSSGVLFASRQANKPLPAASLTKIATTLAALSTWGANHKFTTTISTTGKLVGDTLQGDLVIQGGGDPLFVWEEAIELGNALNRMGIKRVKGDLVITDQFYMNFETDRKLTGNLLKRSLNAANWTDEVVAQYQTMPFGTLTPQVSIDGKVRSSPDLNTQANARTTVLVRHSSLPLWQILKRMNTFSNNEMAEMLTASVGGVNTVRQKAIEIAGVSPLEIRLINGSGLGQQNQISPRAITAMLIALQNLAQTQNLSIVDLMPTGGCNCGTIENRSIPFGAVVKTGTLSDVSTLAGVLPTRDRGLIWFSIVNRGTGDVSVFHQAQDRLLRMLLDKWGKSSTTRSIYGFSPQPWQDLDRNEIFGKQ